MQQIKIEVGGMMCGGCEGSVKKIISRHLQIDIEKVDASHQTNQASFLTDSPDLESLLSALDEAGFPSKSI